MDFGQLFNTLLNSLPNQVWYFVPLFILLPILRTPWFKGKAGEAMVNLAAKLFLDKTRYHLIKNVTLLVFGGDSTFKTEIPENVTKGERYIRFIKSQTEHMLSDVEVQVVVERIGSGRLGASFRTHRENTAHVKEIVVLKESEPPCPECQGQMVPRIVKRGQGIGNKTLDVTRYQSVGEVHHLPVVSQTVRAGPRDPYELISKTRVLLATWSVP